MKSDEDVRMISAEAPVLFARACEFFIQVGAAHPRARQLCAPRWGGRARSGCMQVA